MTTVEKLVYLVRQGAITLERVAPQYREEVAAAVAPVEVQHETT